MGFALGSYFTLFNIFISIYQLFKKSEVKLQLFLLIGNLVFYGYSYYLILFMLTFYLPLLIPAALLISLVLFLLKWKANKSSPEKAAEKKSGSWAIWLLFILLGVSSVVGVAFYLRQIAVEALKKYPMQTAEQMNLSASLVTYKSIYHQWPADQIELQKFIVGTKGDFDFNPYKNLIFKTKEDGDLEVTFEYEPPGKIIRENFELHP